ncbi:MAG: tRNA 2-thiocytidine biosynthesis protein TtcA, partial [Oscillospiraceae bacterium]|nr:tRNA 2-thiocytidine biosynthesis protein TtcA [Oscillospiraceae bacterium]
MIEEGDRIAVGVSGGKDSMCALAGLAGLARFYPKKFSVVAITLDLGYGTDYSTIREYCDSLGVEYNVVETQIKQIVFDIRKEENPCALCANMRRGALNTAALDAGCKKVALGHHLDDAVETFLMSLLFEGRISCFQPVTDLDRTGVIQIRPMLYLHEKTIDTFVT